MTAEKELLDWAIRIYVPPSESNNKTSTPAAGGRTSLAALKDWLNAPTQSGVLQELRIGLAQLSWDAPSAAGRRLISELLWSTVLARFGLVPTLIHRRRRDPSLDPPQFGVYVVDAPHGPDPWERSAWHAVVTISDPEKDDRRRALEWVLNALLCFDVELGLASEPLYLRRYRKPRE